MKTAAKIESLKKFLSKTVLGGVEVVADGGKVTVYISSCDGTMYRGGRHAFWQGLETDTITEWKRSLERWIAREMRICSQW